MRAPYSWLTEFAHLGPDLTPRQLAGAFTEAGLQVERIDHPADAIVGSVVVGRVLDFVEEPQKNGKLIRWCQVDVGEHNPAGQPARGIICGAHNFQPGDLVAVALPGAVLPGGFAIAARKTYGHVSDGMICAEDELGLGEDHAGIIVFPPDPALRPGEDALARLGAREAVFEIDVTPDEGHCLSVRGLAREAAQITGSDFDDPYSAPVPPPVATGHPVVLGSEACPLFIAVRVSGVQPDRPTPEWMVRRLQAVGMRSVSLAVDITNYVMMESGQPLHAYDATCLRGPIRVRRARPGERLTTLDHVERVLSEEDLLITDDSGPIGLAGVMGGLTTELTPTTTEILLEAAWFDPVSIGRTYRRHHLPSEASRRFERGVDRGVAYAAVSRAAELLRDLAGGRIDTGLTVAGGVAPMPGHLLADPGLPGRVLGLEVPQKQVVAILKASGVQVTDAAEGGLALVPPTWRADLVDDYDYVEEVGRKIGFSAIRPRVPQAPAGGGYTRAQRARRAVLSAVADAGFVEVITLPFIGPADLDRLGLGQEDERRQLVRIANPLSDAQPCLRTTLLPGLFAAVARNASRSLSDLALFECGSVFLADDKGDQIMPEVSRRPSPDEISRLFAALPAQPRHLAAVVTGDWRPADGFGPGEPATWRHAVYLAETVAQSLGIDLVRRSDARLPWHPGRCAQLGVISEDRFVGVGWAGQIHPSVVHDWDLPEAASAVELDLDALIRLAPASGQIEPLSAHPATKQDLALVVAATVPAAQVQAALRAGAGALLESISLFDVYQGDQIGDGQKSLAYRLVFRAPDRTLTEKEASQARDAAAAEAARLTGAVMRA